VQLAAAYSLVKLGYPAFAERLREGVHHKDQTVRANAVLLLGKVGDRGDIDLLYSLLRDDSADEKVKFQAIESLARLKDARLYRSKLWALLISKYADDRVMGIRGMGALGTQDAKSAIMTLLGKDGDEVLEVRLCAAEQLGKLGDRSGHDEVAAYLASNPDMNKPEVANLLAAMAIGRIGTPELVAYLPRVLNSRSDAIRLAGAQSALLLAK
jgi:HEAT repeat protein